MFQKVTKYTANHAFHSSSFIVTTTKRHVSERTRSWDERMPSMTLKQRRDTKVFAFSLSFFSLSCLWDTAWWQQSVECSHGEGKRNSVEMERWWESNDCLSDYVALICSCGNERKQNIKVRLRALSPLTKNVKFSQALAKR